MKVSIVLPIYNVEKYIKRCIESILTQTMSQDEIEIIMVDDGSKDSSGRICDEFALNHKNVLVIHQSNAGAAAARNAGLSRAKGEYVFFVDPDDFIEKDYCKKAYDEAVRTGADIVIFDAYKEEVKNNPEGNKDSTIGKIIGEQCADGRGIVKRIVLTHANRDFYTKDRTEILSMQCQILYPYMSARVQGTSFTRNVPLAAPWDKIYKRDFLMENGILFPEKLKVLDDMVFNFTAFGKAKSVAYKQMHLYHYQVIMDSITNSYKKNRPELDMETFRFLNNSINEICNEGISVSEDKQCYAQKKATEQRLRQAYYARIIKSFAICCRLSFFNRQNPLSDKEKKAEVKKYMSMSPYDEAFCSVELKNLEWKLGAVTIAGRLKSPFILKTLDSLENSK